MTSNDKLERRLHSFLEELGKELPGRSDTDSPHELRLFSALVHSLQKDLRWLWEGPEMPGQEKRLVDDDEYEWRRVAASDVKNRNTFVRSVAWLDVFFQKHSKFLEESQAKPLSQLRARVSTAIQQLGISDELWERIDKENNALSRDVDLLTWRIFLEGYEEGRC